MAKFKPYRTGDKQLKKHKDLLSKHAKLREEQKRISNMSNFEFIKHLIKEITLKIKTTWTQFK